MQIPAKKAFLQKADKCNLKQCKIKEPNLKKNKISLRSAHILQKAEPEGMTQKQGKQQRKERRTA